jgi:Glycine zipper
MNRMPTRWTGGRVAARVAILMLGIVLAIAPEAFAWGRRVFGGGYGGGGFSERGFGGGEGSSLGGRERSSGSGGSQVYIYPSRGQSPQQQQTDRGQCYTWAVQQSGFDPANPRVPDGPPPAVGAPQGGLFRGAAGGAALGAIGGAIGGNAGKGAAIGAGTGAVFGGMRRRRWAEQEEFQQTSYLEQQQSVLNQERDNFNQAFSVCMTGRGYTVG